MLVQCSYKKVTTNFDSLVKQILRNQTNIKNGNFVNDWKKKKRNDFIFDTYQIKMMYYVILKLRVRLATLI